MDRSSTPRASQQHQRRQGSNSSGNHTYHDHSIDSKPQKVKNRSRSGSEELSQILAESQSAAQRSKNDPKSHSNGFWPLSANFSRSNSVTPTPHRMNGDGGDEEQHQQQQYRITSPGLLSWVRNAIMSGPSGRAMTYEDNDHSISQEIQSSPVEPIKRNQTPLLPGIIPSFHHIDRQKALQPPLTIQDRPGSERSSTSLDLNSSIGHELLELYDYSSSVRRSSTVSSLSTSSSALNSHHPKSATDSSTNGIDEDEDDDDSDQEDVYVPFAQRQHGPSLIRPTARREALGFGPPSPSFSAPQSEFQTRSQSSALGHGYGITSSEHNLDILEGEFEHE